MKQSTVFKACCMTSRVHSCYAQGLPDFHGEMMRLGSTFTDYPVKTLKEDEPGTDAMT